jgi:hypothetical protein
MKKINIRDKGLIKTNASYQGESIEIKVERIVTFKEPITDGAPLIYVERKEGVQPAYDVRTDRFEVAVEAMDKVSSAKQAKRQEYYKRLEEAEKPSEPMGKEGEA